MLIARIAVPGLALEAYQENRQFRLVIVLAPGRSLPGVDAKVIETTATPVEQPAPGLARCLPAPKLRLVGAG